MYASSRLVGIEGDDRRRLVNAAHGVITARRDSGRAATFFRVHSAQESLPPSGGHPVHVGIPQMAGRTLTASQDPSLPLLLALVARFLPINKRLGFVRVIELTIARWDRQSHPVRGVGQVSIGCPEEPAWSPSVRSGRKHRRSQASSEAGIRPTVNSDACVQPTPLLSDESAYPRTR